MEDSPAVAGPAAPSLRSIPVTQLKPNRWNRTVFDPQSLDELATNIKAEGIIERLIVRPLLMPGQPDGLFEISSGHRRWLAAQKAGLKEVPCEVRILDDARVARDNIVLNITRENLTLLETARMIDEYMTEFQIGKAEVGEIFGKNRSTVSKLLSFLTIDPGVRKGCEILTLGWDPLEALKSSSREIQTQVAQELKDNKLKPEGVAKRCAELGGGKKSKGKGRKEPKSGGETPSPDWNSPIESIWNKIVDQDLVKHEGIFGLGMEYKGNYKWVFAADPEDPPAFKDPAKTTPPSLAQGLGQALIEFGNALIQAAGPVVLKGRTAAIPDGGHPESRSSQEAAPSSHRPTQMSGQSRLLSTTQVDGTASGSPIEKENLSPPVGITDVRDDRRSGQPPLPPSPSKPRSGLTPLMAPRRIVVPVPQIQYASYVSGDKLQIQWAALGEGYAYQVLWAGDRENPRYCAIEENKTVKTPGAVVNVFSEGQSKLVLVAVQAIDPEGHLSEISEPVGFDLKPWNKDYSVLPLPVAVRMPTANPPAAEPPQLPKKPLDPRIAALLAEHDGKEKI